MMCLRYKIFIKRNSHFDSLANKNLSSRIFNTTLMSLLGILEKSTSWANSSLTSHDSRGFQLSPNDLEFERKWYGET